MMNLKQIKQWRGSQVKVSTYLSANMGHTLEVIDDLILMATEMESQLKGVHNLISRLEDSDDDECLHWVGAIRNALGDKNET